MSFYSKEQDYYDENGPKFVKLVMDYYKACRFPCREELEKHLDFFWFLAYRAPVKGFRRENYSIYAGGRKAYNNLSKLMASAEFEFDGKTLNLPMLGPPIFSILTGKSGGLRAKNVPNSLWNMPEELNEIFDKLVKLRTSMAKELGMNNFVPLGYILMERNDYDKDKVANFRKQVKRYLVPLASKIHERRREHLSLDRLSFIR